eukprot:TRINITY_DN1897_c0_g1_i5.p1 TRINITY_DN1897_c0_g1~~TRINITY_DN1897_c0_g1_i5.p1  ORF type:complete len:146 (-),score=16.33 TRINITY_DN1897_c0_g1_i5:1073-1510(-)
MGDMKLDDVWDKETLIKMAKLPGVTTSNPIKALDYFATSELGIEVAYECEEHFQSPTQVIYEQIVSFKDGDSVEVVSHYHHKNKIFAKCGGLANMEFYLSKWIVGERCPCLIRLEIDSSTPPSKASTALNQQSRNNSETQSVSIQ